MLQRLRKWLSGVGLGAFIAYMLMTVYAWATTITWSHTFSDGEVLTASMLETMKSDITSVVNTGGGPVNLTGTQTISGDKTFSGTNTHSGAATFSSTLTANGNVTLGSDSADTVTLNGILQGNTLAVLEGSTANDFEATFTQEDPTADISHTWPAEDSVDLRKRVVQMVRTTVTGFVTGTTQMPYDNSGAPQNTEGTEFMTRAIQPTASNNRLVIDVNVYAANNTTAAANITCGLFQDTTASALASGTVYKGGNNDLALAIPISHEMAAGTTSSTTFKIRCGGNSASTTTFNGQAGGDILSNTMMSSITILEVDVDA